MKIYKFSDTVATNFCNFSEKFPDRTIFTFSVETEAAEKNLKVGFIFLHDENATYEANFMNAAKISCEKSGVEYIFKTNIPESEKCFETAEELVNQG